MTTSYKERLAQLEGLLLPLHDQVTDVSSSPQDQIQVDQNRPLFNESNKVIDLPSLRHLVFHGLPGDEKWRPLVWRLLLGYLPPDKSLWTTHLQKKRTNYAAFVSDLLQIPPEGEDHPLSSSPESKWSEFFKDNDVLLQIDKDVRRLLPEISFFQSPTDFPCESITSGALDRLHHRVQFSSLKSNSLVKRGIGCRVLSDSSSGRKSTADSSNRPSPAGSQIECHWEVVERILFIYAKLNPGQGYVQGMNEIIGPIYFSLATDNNSDALQDTFQWRASAEADTFYVFTSLMSEIRDFFIRSLDDSKEGIRSKMDALMGRLKGRDPQVHQLLSVQEIHPQYFSFRWITLLLSQEFALPEVLRIWDCLLSDQNRFDFLIDLCCAMIIRIRASLLGGDFSGNMKLLQSYPPLDVRELLSLALEHSQASTNLNVNQSEEINKTPIQIS